MKCLLPALVILVAPGNCLDAAEGWRLDKVPIAWTVYGEVKGPQDVSGAAMLGGGHGLLVSDETRAVQHFDLDLAAKRIVMNDATPLLSGKKPELDLEGIAAATKDGCYYATGSHSVSRKSGEVQPDRLRVFRIPADTATGIISRDAITMTTLVPLIESDAVLKDSLGKASDKSGLDIEGIAERDGTLFSDFGHPAAKTRRSSSK